MIFSGQRDVAIVTACVVRVSPERPTHEPGAQKLVDTRLQLWKSHRANPASHGLARPDLCSRSGCAPMRGSHRP